MSFIPHQYFINTNYSQYVCVIFNGVTVCCLLCFQLFYGLTVQLIIRMAYWARMVMVFLLQQQAGYSDSQFAPLLQTAQNIVIQQYKGKLKMSKADKEPKEDNDSDFQSCDTDSQMSIGEQVEMAIKQLPTLQEKVQAIAINHYILQKRELQLSQQEAIANLQYKTRNTYNADIDEVYGFIDGTSNLTYEDYDFIFANKQLLKDNELQQIQKIMKQGHHNNTQISEYWLKCLKNSDIISEQIHPADQEVLKNLYKIDAHRNQDNTKLTVSFWFKPNKWFNNQKITKNFIINKKGQAEKSYGDQIDWKQGKNYTVTIQKQKSKKKGKAVKQIKIKQPSLFHYFQSISSNEQENPIKLDEDAWEDLMEDLEIQHEVSIHIYSDIIPKSLEYYLGCNSNEKHIGCECHEEPGSHPKQIQVIKQQSDGER